MKWAVNPIKLARAKAALGPNATEESLIAYYRSIAGLINEEFLPKPEVKIEEKAEEPAGEKEKEEVTWKISSK